MAFIPNELLMSFFEDSSRSLLDEKETMSLHSDDKGSSTSPTMTTLEICRRKLLDQQRLSLNKVVQHYNNSISKNSDRLSYDQVQERLSGLLSECNNLPLTLKQAMDRQTECARLALCNMVLYVEHNRLRKQQKRQQSPQNTPQDRSKRSKTLLRTPSSSGRLLDKMKLVEYFRLCQTALELPRVQQFVCRGGCSLFEADDGDSDVHGKMATTTAGTTSSKMLFPQTRLEYTQRLLARGMGLDPDYLTQQLTAIFVEKQIKDASSKSDYDGGYYNNNDGENHHMSNIELLRTDAELQQLFEHTVSQMQQVVTRPSSDGINNDIMLGGEGDVSGGVAIVGSRNIKDLNDMNDGGSTRVVSVQYSEIEITPDGRHINVVNAAPGTFERRQGLSHGGCGGIDRDDDNDDAVIFGTGCSDDSTSASGTRKRSEEQQKRQIRIASDAAVLRQELLEELLAMDDDERSSLLADAADAHRRFQHELLALQPGHDRVQFLTSIPLDLSKKLAMHNLWTTTSSHAIQQQWQQQKTNDR